MQYLSSKENMKNNYWVELLTHQYASIHIRLTQIRLIILLIISVAIPLSTVASQLPQTSIYTQYSLIIEGSEPVYSPGPLGIPESQEIYQAASRIRRVNLAPQVFDPEGISPGDEPFNTPISSMLSFSFLIGSKYFSYIVR